MTTKTAPGALFNSSQGPRGVTSWWEFDLSALRSSAKCWYSMIFIDAQSLATFIYESGDADLLNLGSQIPMLESLRDLRHKAHTGV